MSQKDFEYEIFIDIPQDYHYVQADSKEEALEKAEEIKKRMAEEMTSEVSFFKDNRQGELL